MPEIGSLVVDMALKSAEFIRELDKTSKRVEQSQARMTASVRGLEKAFGAFLTVRTIRQISNFTAESLKLAASMHGPLADSANEFLIQFEELQDAFQVGLATGFLEGVADAFDVTEEGLKEAKAAGREFGLILGQLAEQAKTFFGTELPSLIKGVMFQWTELNRVVMDFKQLMTGDFSVITGGVSNFAKNIPGKEATDQILAYGTALELARLEQESFWSATVTEGAVEVGDRFLAQTQAEIDLLNKVGGPIKQYELALLRIEEAHLQGEAATIAHQQATANLVGSYLMLADNVGTALGTLFGESKAVAIAQAVINTAQAITKTFAEYGATPWGFALAASMAAIGAAQIAAIVSAQPGTSKATKTTGVGTATSKAGAASKGRGAPGQAVTINIVGDVFGPEHFRKIVEGINGVQRDGTALIRVAA